MKRQSMHSASGGPLYAADGEETVGAGEGSLPSPFSPNKRAYVSRSVKSTKAGSRGQRKQAQRDTGRRKENVERDGASGRGSESERQGTRGPLDARPSGPAALGPWTGSRGHQKRDSAKSCPTRQVTQ
eukprot:bmy_04044T0